MQLAYSKIHAIHDLEFAMKHDFHNIISSYTGATHVNIVDGKTSVDDVCQSVKETQNVDDDLTLTDVKGYEFTDSESVNCKY